MDTETALSLLGLRPGATGEEIRAAYRRMVMAWHPDRYDDGDRSAMEGSMKRLNMACEVLRNYVPKEQAAGQRHRQERYGRDASSSAGRHRRPETAYHERATRERRPRGEWDWQDQEVDELSVPYRNQEALTTRYRPLASSPEKLLLPSLRLAIVVLAIGTLFWGVYATVAMLGSFFSSLGQTAGSAAISASAPANDATEAVAFAPMVPVWTESSLAATTFRNGDPILHATTKKEWKRANRLRTGAWCHYGNDPSKGVLYNRYAVNDPRGLAPEGWHIATEQEWKDLAGFGDLSIFLREQGGFRKSGGGFSHYGKRACFWIAGSRADNNNMALELSDFDFTHEGDIIDNTGEGYSVRCVKD